MRFDYGSLWNLLTDKQMENLKNTTNLASATIAKLSKEEPVLMEVSGGICRALECNIEDIVFYGIGGLS